MTEEAGGFQPPRWGFQADDQVVEVAAGIHRTVFSPWPRVRRGFALGPTALVEGRRRMKILEQLNFVSLFNLRRVSENKEQS